MMRQNTVAMMVSWYMPERTCVRLGGSKRTTRTPTGRSYYTHTGGCLCGKTLADACAIARIIHKISVTTAVRHDKKWKLDEI
jgi:hypothetical protein